MAIDGIASFSSHNICTYSSTDAEWERILRRLREYGIKTSGSKATDWAKLHDIELQEAKNITVVSNKFVTIKKGEQEKIIARKKERKQQCQIKNKNTEKELNPDQYNNTQKAMNILGEQIYLAIKMKKKS